MSLLPTATSPGDAVDVHSETTLPTVVEREPSVINVGRVVPVDLWTSKLQ